MPTYSQIDIYRTKKTVLKSKNKNKASEKEEETQEDCLEYIGSLDQKQVFNAYKDTLQQNNNNQYFRDQGFRIEGIYACDYLQDSNYIHLCVFLHQGTRLYIEFQPRLKHIFSKKSSDICEKILKIHAIKYPLQYHDQKEQCSTIPRSKYRGINQNQGY